MTTTSRSEDPKPPSGRELLARLLKVAQRYAEGKITSKQVGQRLREIAAWLDGVKPAESPARKAEDPRELQVFRYWQQRLGKERAQLTDGRRAKIRARIKEGYTVADLCRAIDGAAESAFHRGENESGTEYLDITLILRNGEKLEGFRDRVDDEQPAKTTGSESRDAKLAALQREAAEHLKEKRIDAYNQTNRKIKELRQKV